MCICCVCGGVVMRGTSRTARAPSAQTIRSDLRLTEASFGSILTDIAELLYPPPNTAAKIAAELGCSVRNVELYLAGRQKWSGDAVAHFVSEICKRHAMRNVRITKR